MNAADRSLRVYLAGKISKNDWRHQLIAGLRNHSWEDGPLTQSGFTYVGPFFISCDHGGFHGPNTHGMRPRQDLFDKDKRKLIFCNCKHAIKNCDLLFAYIDANDAYGTLVEIGMAIALEKKVVIVFGEHVASSEANEMWFAAEGANLPEYNLPAGKLPEYFNNIVSSTSASLCCEERT